MIDVASHTIAYLSFISWVYVGYKTRIISVIGQW
jgi:hypothetical protein